MTKREMIMAVAAKTGQRPVDVDVCLKAFLETLEDGLQDGQRMPLPGFGTFSISLRREQYRRHPETFEKILVPPRRAVRFQPSARLKEAVNDG